MLFFITNSEVITLAEQITSLQVLISGKVQGVGYRYSTREKAIALNIVGWVRNLPNGQVEALIIGKSTQIEQMLTWFQSGPPAAKVSSIETEETDPKPLNSFKIHR